MRVERFNGDTERQILISCITDRPVLAQIASIYQNDMMSASWSNLLLSWCVKFYKKYQKAPGKAIEGMFSAWAVKAKDQDTIDLIEGLLTNLNKSWKASKNSNSQYFIDMAAKHFNRVKAAKTVEIVQGCLDNDDVDAALERIRDFKKVDIGKEAPIDLFNDPLAVEEIFEEQQQDLIEYPGALGEFFRGIWERSGFVAFCASEKKGKSIWLLDVAYRAVQQRNKVLYIQAGDLSRRQIKTRFAIRAARKPLSIKNPIKFPLGIEKIENEYDVETIIEDREFKEALSIKDVNEAFEKFVEKTKTKESLFKLICHSNLSVTAMDIKNHIQELADEGWIPDIVINDYADNMAPISSKREHRHEIKETWSTLRQISLDYNILMVTATQADARSYNAKVLDMSHFSESKTKNAEATAIIGINYTDEEKEKGVTRLNFINRREGYFSTSKCVFVAGCRGLNNPAVGKLSTW